MKVAVAVALPGRQEVVEVILAPGATVADAIVAACLAERFPGLDADRLTVGIWSRVVPRSTRLREGDRVELYRELVADPKEARRERARLRPRSRNAP
jgi:putative ubiquitin-RnfH superfamily antitoxin RatB of RatAB toxin-antitoxin module